MRKIKIGINNKINKNRMGMGTILKQLVSSGRMLSIGYIKKYL